jgi:glycosyltransferase involved in cell wall biosynthesis
MSGAEVSVVVPVHNGAGHLGACLHGLANQALPRERYEVIVVDDGSTDGTHAVAERFEGVQLIRQSRTRTAGARNAGWRAASARWIASIDSDCVPSRAWLTALLGAVTVDNDAPVVGAAGKTIGYGSDTAAARFVDLFGSYDAGRHLAHPAFPFASACNFIVRRSALEAVDGFDDRFVHYEAPELFVRLRGEVPGAFGFEPRAVVLHRHRAGWRGYWRQQRGYGRGYAQFLWLHRDEIPWSLGREARAWLQVAALGIGAAGTRRGDAALVRRGRFVKELALRVGFDTTYWSRRERARW